MMQRLPGLRAGWITASVLLGILSGTGGYTFYEARGWSYLSNNPTVCINCHVMRDHFDGWQKASHHGVAVCNDCHVPHAFPDKWFVKAENGYLHAKAFTLENFHEPIRMRDKSHRLLNENCLHCHAEMVEPIVAHASTRAVLDCVRCHRDVGHGPVK